MEPAPLSTPEPLVAAAATTRWRSFYELTKPRVVMLIVFTSIVGTLLAVPGMPPLDALVFGNLGVGLAAASPTPRLPKMSASSGGMPGTASNVPTIDVNTMSITTRGFVSS